ncbi:MAG: tungsten transporter substrate-binding protein [Clostridia bacterium]|jgi:tungstate transport system substrate-binding protein|nr:tungsten transporter substrate-binding protein [Clostridia bacterium]
MKNKMIVVFSIILILITVICSTLFAKISAKKANSLLIGSTTSLQDSGLLDELLPEFYEETGIEAKVIAVGTGQAMKLGQDGDVDVLLVHDKPSEIAFVEEGHGIKRWDVMYNDFILLGPQEDPLHIKDKAGTDILEAFKLIASQEAEFISRGDNSGTHKKELGIWKELNIEPTYNGYISAGKGMGDVLKMADELRAYVLTDRATYLKLSSKLALEVVTEGDQHLMNMYGVIAINPEKNKAINSKGAQTFIKWLLSPAVQKKIGEYGKDANGRALFNPAAKAYDE